MIAAFGLGGGGWTAPGPAAKPFFFFLCFVVAVQRHITLLS